MDFQQVSYAEADKFTIQKDISLRIAKVTDDWAEFQRRYRGGQAFQSAFNLFLADLQALWQQTKWICRPTIKGKAHRELFESLEKWFNLIAAGHTPEAIEAYHILDGTFYILKRAGILNLNYGETAPKSAWRENL